MHPLISLSISVLLLSALAWVFWPETGLYQRWQRVRKLSGRVLAEDTLKHLFSSEADGREATLHSIAGAISANQNEVAGIVGSLEQKGHLLVRGHGFKLTPTGREHALRIIRAHRIWESYLSDQTGHHEEDWHNLAERYEHQLSPEDVDALATSLGNPSYDPHGDPIPTADGDYRERAGMPLTSLGTNRTARIVHLEDEPAVIYSQLIAEGLHTGLALRLLEKTPEKVRFWANGDEHVLAPVLASNITVQEISHEAHLTESGIPLSDLGIGESARIVTIAPGIRGAQRRRLMDLGLLPGTEITAELQSPSGDPTGYIIRGTLIALRADQARQIKIASNGH
jgi:DtxR family Mn-dependent transcriptional regulator